MGRTYKPVCPPVAMATFPVRSGMGIGGSFAMLDT
jgi:hypothetical protein